MAEEDRRRWDERYAEQGTSAGERGAARLPSPRHADAFPTDGTGARSRLRPGTRAAVWLARRGMDVWGLDVSAVAIGQARDLAQRSGVGDRCRFDVFDLDDGLPDGPPVDVILCHKFRDRRLDHAIIDRLAPGGLLAIVVLSEVDASPGAVSRRTR